jgi:hypothetical protein
MTPETEAIAEKILALPKEKQLLLLEWLTQQHEIEDAANVATRPLRTVAEAYALLEELGAPAKLLRHVSLVNEAADELLAHLGSIPFTVNTNFVRLGVALHDAGKILHLSELTTKGNQHEAAGEQLLIQHGVSSRLARCCRSHAQWTTMDCCFEELLIALADTLWKGKRNQELEQMVISYMGKHLENDQWELLVMMDSCFEKIASRADDRLARS